MFNALAKSGKADVSVKDRFWGDYGGTVTDKPGIQWIFNCAEKAKQAGAAIAKFKNAITLPCANPCPVNCHGNLVRAEAKLTQRQTGVGLISGDFQCRLKYIDRPIAIDSVLAKG